MFRLYMPEVFITFVSNSKTTEVVDFEFCLPGVSRIPSGALTGSQDLRCDYWQAAGVGRCAEVCGVGTAGARSFLQGFGFGKTDDP